MVLTSDGWILFSQPGLSSWIPTSAGSEVWISGKRYQVTKIISDTLTNLMMVKVDGQNFTAIPFGTSDKVRSGEIIFGLSGDQNLLATSLTDVHTSLATVYQAEEYSFKWTIDTDIGPASEPVVNASGELIGFLDINKGMNLNNLISSDFWMHFTVLAQALPLFNGPTLLSLLFFLFLSSFLVFGVLSLAYSISNVLVQKFNTKHINAAIIVSGLGFLFGLLFVIKPGFYIMDIVTHFIYYIYILYLYIIYYFFSSFS